MGVKKIDLNVEFERLIREAQKSTSQEALSFIAQELLNLLMLKQRELFLKQQKEQNTKNKANGFYERELACLFGLLNLNVPRDREALFRSSILPDKWKKTDSKFDEFLLNLVFNSYSPNQIKSLLHKINLPYSPEEIDKLKKHLYQKALELKNKDLPQDIFALFIDAYHCQIKDEKVQRVRNATIYTVIGIDLEGNKDLFGYYCLWGHENKGDWLQIFNDLINRGLKRVMIIVSDDFPGLDEAIKTLFPRTDHQLCYVHLQRNLFKNMAKKDAQEFNKFLKSLRYCNSFEEALEKFKEACEKLLKKYPRYMRYLLGKAENYLAFLRYPEGVRKHIYTTNIVENFHSKLEVARTRSGGYFQSMKTAEVSIYVVYENMKDRRWKKPLPGVRSCSYELKQMFHLKFQTQFS